MKKTAILLLLLSLTELVFAGFSFDLGPVNIDLIPQKPLYEPHIADIWAPNINLHYMKMITPGPDSIGVTTEREQDATYFNDNPDESMREHTVYEKMKFKTEEEQDDLESYVRFVLAEQFSVLRIAYDWYEVEFLGNGGLSTVFEASGGTDIVGFDGFFFLGGAFRFSKKVSVKIGAHHYSGHYGDELIENLLPDAKGRNYKERMDFEDGVPGKIYKFEQYVRQNSLVVGVSADVTSWLKLYAEADVIPPVMHVVRPWVLAPNQGITNDSGFEGESVESYSGTTESNYEHHSPDNARKNPYPDSYKDIILQFGAEARIPAGRVGNFVIAGDIMLFDSSKTGYQIGAYSEELYGWSKDINIAVAFEFADSPLRIDATYHNGRFPMTNFFFHQCSYFSVGLCYKH